MAVKLKVVYTDGREVEVVASPRAQVMTEKYLGGYGESRQVEGGYYLAWASLHKAGKEPADYETWLDTIADVGEVTSEVTPTVPAQPDGTSSD
jgi:hypothetical protein